MAASVPSLEALSTTITRSMTGSVSRARQPSTMSRELWVSTTASTTRGRKASVTRLAAETTIAILNYDGRALLERVLPSIANQDHPSFRVVVIDNGSSDDSASWLHREWPDVDVVELPENVGVTAALNKAVESAKGEFVALLNNDIELEPS